MTTKAFTSALGYGITVRGYIDEDDKLVLLEPEGSGGGDFNMAALTVESEVTPPLTVAIPAINSEGNGVIVIVNQLVSGEYTIPLYGDGCAITLPKSDEVEYTISGDIELVATGASVLIYRVYGDASITAENDNGAV